MSKSLAVLKTYKLYIGGNFVRGESGRCLVAASARGAHLANVCHASRKDFRDAVVAARGAFEGWAKKSAYLRGQILYRAAEMLQPRAQELAHEIARSTGVSSGQARREASLAAGRLVYFAGWTDKYQAVFSSVNPVASPHFNFTVPEPTGVVVVVAPDEPSLVSLVSLLAPVLSSGNAAVVIASDRYPLPALTFCEILATSDFPAGVVNVLAGRRRELAEHIARHLDVNAIVDGAGDAELAAELQTGTAHNLKRYANHALPSVEWFGRRGQDPYRILDTVEFKTAWHPIGL